MAKKLSAESTTQGPNSESFSLYYREFRQLDHAARSANGKLREFWKRVKADGFDVKEMKATIAEQDIDPDEIRKSDAIRATYRGWLGLPVGTQAGFDFTDAQKQTMAAEQAPESPEPPEPPLDEAVAAAASKPRKSRARAHAEQPAAV
jgi:uncharacterized protein (UPF0335 family)